MAAEDSPVATPGPPGSPPARLYGWRRAPVVSAAVLAIASGFGQFGAVAALADVAEAFGEATAGGSVAEQAGLSGTVLGVGLAVIRLATLGATPLAARADGWGRRPLLLACAAAGLAFVVLGALSPGYWWFVAAFAASRPFLSATITLAQVMASEHTAASDRAKAVALVSAGYGLGAATVAVVRGAANDALGFRGTFALALVPLALLAVVRRWVVEPERYEELPGAATRAQGRAWLRRAGIEGRRRLGAMVVVAFAAAFVTGPANSFVFVYAEGVLGVSAGVTALLLLAAVPVGLAGLVLGRLGADRWGRRPTAALTLAGLGVGAVVTYASGVPSTIAGSLLAVLAGYAFAPTIASFASELFPTEVRARVAGWLVATGVIGAVAGLVVFGFLADALDGFGPAAVVVAIPPVVAIAAFPLLPETKGLELERSAGTVPLPPTPRFLRH